MDKKTLIIRKKILELTKKPTAKEEYLKRINIRKTA